MKLKTYFYRAYYSKLEITKYLQINILLINFEVVCLSSVFSVKHRKSKTLQSEFVYEKAKLNKCALCFIIQYCEYYIKCNSSNYLTLIISPMTAIQVFYNYLINSKVY